MTSLIEKIHEKTGQPTTKINNEYDHIKNHINQEHTAGNKYAETIAALEKATHYKSPISHQGLADGLSTKSNIQSKLSHLLKQNPKK